MEFEVPERRAHQRLDLKLNVLVGDDNAHPQIIDTASSINIGTGGVLLSTLDPDRYQRGRIYHLQIDVPPGAGQFAFPGKVYADGRVVRMENDADDGVMVAMRFDSMFKFQFRGHV